MESNNMNQPPDDIDETSGNLHKGSNPLQSHYNRKYANECISDSIDLIKIGGIPTSRFDAVIKYFPEYFKGGDILEIGAGNGNVAKTLLNMELGITSYTLGDISLPRVAGLRKNLGDSRINILEIDADNICENELSKYDAVVMIALIEHLIDPMRAMQMIKQHIKPGGFVYIDTPNFAKYTRRLKLLAGKFPSTASKNEGLMTYSNKPTDLYDEGHLHYFTYRSLSLMLLERCGYSKIIKLAYPSGNMPLGKYLHNYMASFWPEMFSELAIIAYI
jgi:2-polyprenyl-3-methyl-5-hydroxy-6-metoxy-1,4-benzoquinol methylase